MLSNSLVLLSKKLLTILVHSVEKKILCIRYNKKNRSFTTTIMEKNKETGSKFVVVGGKIKHDIAPLLYGSLSPDLSQAPGTRPGLAVCALTRPSCVIFCQLPAITYILVILVLCSHNYMWCLFDWYGPLNIISPPLHGLCVSINPWNLLLLPLDSFYKQYNGHATL